MLIRKQIYVACLEGLVFQILKQIEPKPYEFDICNFSSMAYPLGMVESTYQPNTSFSPPIKQELNTNSKVEWPLL
jgi:hypothetical protein